MFPKTVYVIRHTTPLVEPGICYGQTDLPLADSFQKEADSIHEKLNGFLPQVVISSCLQRCTLLAKKLFNNNSVSTDHRLAELNFGDWEMKPWSAIDRALMDKWSTNFYSQSPPNGETFQHLNNRTIEAWQQHITNSKSTNIALVTHSGNIRCLLMHYLQIPHNQVFNLKLTYGAILKIEINSPIHSTVELL